MRRVIVLVSNLLACALLGACAQESAGGPAKPERTPTATPTPGLVLLDISGSDSHQSNMFTAPKNWDISWQAQADPNTTGSFIAINIYDPHGNPAATTI